MEWVKEWLFSNGIYYREQVLGGRLTTFGSGGAVRYVAEPRDEREVSRLIAFLRDHGVMYRVLGGGSNVLLPDDGYNGVILLTDKLMDFRIKGGCVTVGAGVRLPVFSRKCRDCALSGAEFAEGIPGSVGGAVYMNASAFGEGVSDVLTGVRLLLGGEVVTIPASELRMGYHKGGLPARSVLLGATVRLTEGDRESIGRTMRRFAERRATTQPKQRSAGSVFARVGDTPAAVFIEKTGLKGMRIGGAELSAKHCNFIINRGGATTTEYIRMAEEVRRVVKEQSGVTLEYEVEYIG